MRIDSVNFSETGQIVSADVAYGNMEYWGISVVETTGSASATVKIYSGSDNTGRLLEVVTLVANESARELYPVGIEADGMYAEVTGSVEASLRYASEDRR